MWLEIFRTGIHTDSSGRNQEYTAEMLDDMAAAYNSHVADDASYEAPVVKGHPKDDAPAYGWVERLARRGSRLLANLRELQPEFVEELSSGKFKNVSISLYPDLMLRHIGFLGAAVPAVKGLRSVGFQDSTGVFEYTNNIVLSENPEKSVTSSGFQSPYPFTGKQDSQTSDYSEIIRKNEELTKLNEEYARKIYLLEKESRLKEYRDYANYLIENPGGSIITPAQADNLVDILENAYLLDMQKAGSEFSESCYVDKIKNFVSGLKPIFSLDEFARKNSSPSHNNFRDFTGINVSAERLRLHDRAVELTDEVPGLSYEEAVCMAQRELGGSNL